MPKLSHPKIIEGQAAACLVRLYRNDTAFMKELKQLRQPYLPLLSEVAAAWLKFSRECAKVLSPPEFQKFYECYLRGDKQAVDLPAKLDAYVKQAEQTEEKLEPYKRGLDKLAYQCKLRAPWAWRILLLYDLVEAAGIPEEVTIPIDLLDFIYPFQPPMPPLEVKVSSWALILYDKQEIVKQIGRRLAMYEDELKKMGLRERPSALEKHAWWWFQHYVHNKTYDEIAQMETYTPDGSLISYRRNVGTAVRRFSRLVGISLQTLK